MKVYVHYEDNTSEDLHLTLKLTLPKKWVDQPIKQVLEVSSTTTGWMMMPYRHDVKLLMMMP